MLATRALALPLVLLLILGGRPASAESGAMTSLEFPRTLKVESTLAPKIVEMLARSPAFREQCLRIDEADNLVVVLRVNPLLPRTLFSARSTLTRYSSGLLLVDVEVAAGSHQTEWIAHEFEHVLETIEGRGVPRMAREQARGVWRSVDGMIETSRATDAGRRVMSEMLPLDSSDNSVE